ncbi:MAG: DUF99 family protein [Thermoplasmata archaeon]|nr:DUF99 family protein [Thermoplasmata archaeon]
MKTQFRILGIDDAAFDFGDEKARVVGVVVRCPAYVEGVMISEVTVDGMDSSDVIIKMVNTSRYKRQLKLIVIDGAALGGFNVVDINRVFGETGIPVATITRDKPDFKEIESALRAHFQDWKERLDMMQAGNLEMIETDNKPAYVDRVGMELAELKDILAHATVRGALPEAVRLAHLIGTAIAKGESHGRA